MTENHNSTSVYHPVAVQPLREGFWYAFRVSLDEFAGKNYFTELFGAECSDGHPMSWHDGRVKSVLEANYGQFDWPISKDSPPSNQVILDLVEFFYANISEPIQSWSHSYCGNDHPIKYESGKGRYVYTVKVNALFQRFKQPYKLVRGKVLRANSTVLDENLILPDIEMTADDAYLKGLIARALEHFYDSKTNHKIDGLCTLVDAYERLKTIKNPTNKKESTETLVNALALEKAMAPHINALFRELTTISNEKTIRHHEHGKEIISDQATIEFLFYAYYNAIRFMASVL